MGGQAQGQLGRVCLGPLQAHAQGAHTPQGQPGLQGPGHGAVQGAPLGQRLGQPFVAPDGRAQDHVGVTGEELGHAVHDHVHAQLERSLQQGRGEGVVGHHQGHPGVVGARDVGVTYRPQVFFSQAIDPASLNDNNFYAIFSGQKLPARIVPADTGAFAWLFFRGPLPAGSMIQVTVDGSTIRSSDGTQTLDADGNGVPGGVLTFQFSTVSLTPVAGTSLSGMVVDPETISCRIRRTMSKPARTAP